MSVPVATRSLSSLSLDTRSIHSYASSESSSSSTAGRTRQFRSSGRGGSGNIRRKSDASQNPSEPDASVPDTPVSPVGREPALPIKKAVSVGRGGAGNVHASWRDQVHEGLTQTASILSDHAASVAEYEKAVIRKRMEERRVAAISSGRGGSGNITKIQLPFLKPKTPSSSKSKGFRFSRSRSDGNLRPSHASFQSSETDSSIFEEGEPSNDE